MGSNWHVACLTVRTQITEVNKRQSQKRKVTFIVMSVVNHCGHWIKHQGLPSTSVVVKSEVMQKLAVEVKSL